MQTSQLRTVATAAQSHTSQPLRPLSTSSAAQAAEHDEAHADHGSHSHYDPPTGWLWGQPPGTKYEREGWEYIWYFGVCGGLVAGAVAYAFKPDTRYV